MRGILIIFLLSFTGINVFAQRTIINQGLYWLRYNNQLHFSEKLYWNNDFEERRFFENNRQHHFIVHSRLHYKIAKKIEIAGGFTYSLQSPQEPDAVNRLVVPELRPAQQFTLFSKISPRFSMDHRIRIDERFIRRNNGRELLAGYDFNFRFRYRLQASFRINKKENKNIATLLRVSDEIMFNAGKNIVYNKFDQNRIYLGIEQGLSPNISLELGYMQWFQRRAKPSEEYFDRDIFRLAIHHKIKLKR